MMPDPLPKTENPQLPALLTLLRAVRPMGPQARVAEAAERIQKPEYAGLLCIPVVEDGHVLGTVSRQQLTSIFLHRFGRELYGNRPVTRIMNGQPLRVSLEEPLERAAEHVAANIGTPLSEDFVLTRGGLYAGMGVVVDLLAAVQERVARGAAQLDAAYRELKSSQSALVQSEKMASLGQMVAGVAHEINTPLGYVRNNVEMVHGVFGQVTGMLGEYQRLVAALTDPAADEAAVGAQLTALEAMTAELRESQVVEDTEALFSDTLFGVDTIRDLVVNLRNFSRMDAARVADVSLNDCVEQTLTIAGSLIRNRVQVIKQLGELPRLSCSPSQINQVLLNLVTNALQAMPEADARLLLRTEADAHWVRVLVQDNGRGIAAEHLDKIFDPFFTTKPVGQGTGLGLSISYQIVQAHGGRIEVASTPGVGTRFTVSLPLRAAA